MYRGLLQQKNGFWLSHGPYSDIVLSSRIRLARNIGGIPFPNKMTEEDNEKLRSILNEYASKSKNTKNLNLIDLNEIGIYEKRFLRERNIITYEMEVSETSYIIINETDDYTIMINDEDHLRIQVIRPGLQFNESYRLAGKIEDELNRFIPFAFSKQYGYLTACPSNIGTGLKVSAILHLPVLSINDRISQIMPKLKKAGAAMKGTAGSGIKTAGNIYQVSNKISLGISEVDIIELMDGIITKILELEDNSRDRYLSESRIELEDMVLRSLGILKYSRRITYTEAMDHLSNVRLGVILAIIKKINLSFINNLMVNIQWSHLQKNFEEVFNTSEECDEYRAEYLRSNL